MSGKDKKGQPQPAAQGYPSQQPYPTSQPQPGQYPQYGVPPPQYAAYPPQGPPPPYSTQPQPGQYPTAQQGQYPATQYAQAPPPQQTVVVPGAFDAGARFGTGSTANIPPPPPGVAPNAAQMAQMQGHNIQLGQRSGDAFTGGSDGGYTWW